MSSDFGNTPGNTMYADASHLPVDVMATSTPTFRYQPLDAEEHQIRLLKIILNDVDQPVSCALSVFPLGTRPLDKNEGSETRKRDAALPNTVTTPDYIALSYTWGAPTSGSNFHILVNGSIFSVRENLYRFLIDFKAEGEDVYLWIDQVCIDQGNLQERSAQVRIMGTVYENSTEVIVWLGNDSNELQSAARQFGNERLNAEDRNALDADMDALVILLNNKYFTRLWIVQEVILAHKIRVLVRGNIWASWNRMVEVFYHLHGLRGNIDSCGIPPSAAWLLHHQNTNPPFRSLSKWIDTFGQSECDDPRDKVYGMMAIVHPDSRLSVDYTKTVVEVCLDVMAILWAEEVPVDLGYRNVKQMNTIVKLGLYMGLNAFQCEGMQMMLHSIPEPWKPSAISETRNKVVITGVGYEGAGARILTENTLRVNESAVLDRWWIEVNGRRQYQECGMSGSDQDVVVQGWGCLEDTSCFERVVNVPIGFEYSEPRSNSRVGPPKHLKAWGKRWSLGGA